MLLQQVWYEVPQILLQIIRENIYYITYNIQIIAELIKMTPFKSLHTLDSQYCV